jgi:hypothetical protein
MNRLSYVLLLALVSIVPVAYTQGSTSEPSLNTEKAKQVLTKARRDIFEETMGLTPEQKDGFWAIYNDYERDRMPVTEETIRILQAYTNNFSTLTNDQLMKLMKEASQNNKKMIDLRYKYAEQMGKKVDPKVAVRFYEIDDYISTATRLDVLDNIPFVGEIQ